MANLVLSDKEWQVIQNFDFILTKNSILEKMQHFLENLGATYVSILKEHPTSVPSEIFTYSPKVSKGEKYEGLPYLILDYPRIFSQKDIFSVRSFFLWGKTFAIFLLVSGKYKQQLQEKLHSNKSLGDWKYEVNDSPWIHFSESDDLPLFKQIKTSQITEHLFLKISLIQPLDQWQSIDAFYISAFNDLIAACFS